MHSSTAQIATPFARRYLQQLCTHFGRKVPVEVTPDAGRITLPFGTCELTASADRLCLVTRAKTRNLPKLETVMTDHLDRFAFRENPVITWYRAT